MHKVPQLELMRRWGCGEDNSSRAASHGIPSFLQSSIRMLLMSGETLVVAKGKAMRILERRVEYCRSLIFQQESAKAEANMFA
jgi:hypothetical protein